MKPEPRKIGGSKSKKDNGVSTLNPLSYYIHRLWVEEQSLKLSEPTEWQKLLKKTREKQGLSLKDAIKYVKDNNLYQFTFRKSNVENYILYLLFYILLIVKTCN